MILWNALQIASLVSLVSSAKVLFKYQGTELPTIGPDGDFNYITLPFLKSDDGKLTIEDDHLVVNSHPFKHTRDDIFDAVKFQVFTNRRFECDAGKVVVQMIGSAVMHGVEDNPFGEEFVLSQIDARLAASVFRVQDDRGQVFDFVIANGKIGALIQPRLITPPGVEATSTMCYNIPLVDTEAGEEHTLALIFDATAHSVSWSVDGIIHYTWTADSQIPQENCVLRWGDLNRFTYPNNFVVGFGSYSSLVYYLPVSYTKAFNVPYKGLVNLPFQKPLLNPQTGEPAEYIVDSDDQKYHVWGQGATQRIRSVVVTREV